MMSLSINVLYFVRVATYLKNRGKAGKNYEKVREIHKKLST